MQYDAVLKLAPEDTPVAGYVVWGHIYNDKKLRFPDGHLVHTSRILEIIAEPSGTYIKTLNSIYKLEA